MSVTDFECAIAKSQIGRYIAGDNLAPEVARQLENHIDNCPRCKQLLQEKKNSLEAMIGHQSEAETPIIQVKNEPVAMTRPATDGSSALKPDFMEVLADSARTSLREKLKETARAKAETVEVPAVAPAFAYKDAELTETVSLSAEKPKKKGFLSSFALYENVPDEQPKPSLSADNIRSAKAVFRDNNQSLRKPMMYMAGLCCVVAAMSFVLRDPTTLFGGKVAAKGSAVVVPTNNKNTPKTAKLTKKPASKVLPHKPAQLNDAGVDAQTFTDEPVATAKPKTPAKATIKPKLTTAKPLTIKKAAAKPALALKTTKTEIKPVVKTAVKPKPKAAKPVVKAISKQTAKATSAQHFALKAKAKTVRHSTPKHQPAPAKENVVKLYTNDPTPTPKEQK